ncbi:hypothetical protein N9Z14_02525 [Opitutales bacterium]|nr:hypothetical protein [Opitutales bacterium]
MFSLKPKFPSFPVKAASTSAPKQGFALVIALSLMAFILLLILSITTLVQVETQSAQISVARMEAEQNAMLGLKQALGELQMAAGPDQRVTATAAIFDADPSTATIEGVENPRWVAAMPTVDPSRTNAPLEDFAENNRSYALGFTTNSRLSGAQLSSNQLRWLASMPDGALNNPAQPLNAPAATIAGDADEVVTIHTYRETAVETGIATDETVEVGKVPVLDTNGSRQGSFAWWVEDEGVKATFNLEDHDPDFVDTQSDLGLDETLYPLLQARQANFGYASTDSDAPSKTFSEVIDDGSLGRLFSSAETSFLDDNDGWKTWLENRSADITFNSFTVPVDVTLGRLKQDLTVYLETGEGLDDSDDILRSAPGDNGGGSDLGYDGPNYRSAVDFGSDDNLPKFGILKGWNELGKDLANGVVESRPQTLTQQGLHPHVKRAGIMLSMAMTGLPTENPGVGWDAEFVLVAYPFIELWNPYSVALPPEKYLAEVTMPDRVILDGRPNLSSGNGGRITSSATPTTAVVDFDVLGDGLVDTVNSSDYEFGEDRAWLRMVVDTGALSTGPAGLQPGESVLVSPEIGAVQQLGYDKSLKYSDYNSGTDVNLAEDKVITIDAYNLPDGAYIFWNHPKSVTLPTPDPSNTRYYRVRYKIPNTGDGTADPQWNNTDATVLFRLSRLDGGVPTLLTYRDPTRSNLDSGNHEPNGQPVYGWDPGSGAIVRDDGTNPLNPFQYLPYVSGTGFSGTHAHYARGPRNADTIFVHAAALAFSWMQGGNRILASENPRGGILRTGLQLPAGWTDRIVKYGDDGLGKRPIHRNEPYQTTHFSGHWRLPTRQGLWGRSSGIEGFFNGGQPNNFDSHQLSGVTHSYFDFPRRYGPIHSLGQLMHANLNPMPWGSSWQVGYSRAASSMDRDDRDELYDVSGKNNWELPNQYIDLPYLINASVMDRFYLSTIPQNRGLNLDDGTPVLPNNRHELYGTTATPLDQDNLQDSEDAFERSAANVLVEGSFNVNSTSVVAWEAFLLSKAGIAMQVDSLSRSDNRAFADYNTSGDAAFVAFPRVPDPVFGVADNAAFDAEHPRKSYFARGGNHVTDRTEIRELAKAIVEEVKRRGPFLSMADFVNRRLLPDASGSSSATSIEQDYQGLMGTLDAAIMKTSQNAGMLNNQLFAGEDAGNTSGVAIDPDLKKHANHFPSSADDREQLYAVPRGQEDSTLEGMGAYLMQGDLLANLGSAMSPRSDTFTIRAFGESTDPITGVVNSTARCEAVVQRIADTVDPDDDLIVPDSNGFGRKFTIVSFKWIDEG